MNLITDDNSRNVLLYCESYYEGMSIKFYTEASLSRLTRGTLRVHMKPLLPSK